MRRSPILLTWIGKSTKPNLIQIQKGTFYREHPSTVDTDSNASNPALFRDLTFNLPATLIEDVGLPKRKDQHWAVISANDGTTFLEILRGSHLCFPPNARTFPYLASEDIERKDHKLHSPSRAIQYVGFNTGKGQSMGGGIRGAYLSARYESYREETDWTVLQYLKGETELNPSETQSEQAPEKSLLDKVVSDLKLQDLAHMPVSNLSNGQTRRARIAKALLGKPELLLLDEPFMGLDPPTLVRLSPILRDLAYRSSPLLLLALRPQDPIPDWITHLAVLGHHHTVSLMGPKAQVLFSLHRWADAVGKQKPDTEKTSLVTQMADGMTENYGVPLMGVGDTLSANGIIKYDHYNQVIAPASIEKYFDPKGLVRPEQLSTEDEALWMKAKEIPESERSLQDLLVLTTTLPVESESEPISTLDSKNAEIADKHQTHQNDTESTSRMLGEPLIELKSVVVKYGDKKVLGFPPPQPGYSEPGLNLGIHQGTRLALLGPNGSGKTTLLSLLTSDHPHSYSLPIKFFGRSRLPSAGNPGLSLWDIQSRIGHSSPEIHAFFPKRLTVRQVLESAWSETYAAKPKLSFERDELVNIFLRWWEPELRQNIPEASSHRNPGRWKVYRENESNAIRTMIEQSYPPFIPPQSRWGDDDVEIETSHISHDLSWAEDTNHHSFSVLPFSAQRLLLFLRAIIKSPDIVILDEAFSGFSTKTRDKAMCWLEYGETKFLPTTTVTGTHDSNAINSKGDTTPITNYCANVLSLARGMDIDLTAVVRGRKRTGMYDDIRHMSMEELLQKADEAKKSESKVEMSIDPFAGLMDKQALVVVSHVKEEIPPVVDEWVRLPGEEEVRELGKGVEMGRCDGGWIRTAEGWNKVWGF